MSNLTFHKEAQIEDLKLSVTASDDGYIRLAISTGSSQFDTVLSHAQSNYLINSLLDAQQSILEVA